MPVISTPAASSRSRIGIQSYLNQTDTLRDMGAKQLAHTAAMAAARSAAQRRLQSQMAGMGGGRNGSRGLGNINVGGSAGDVGLGSRAVDLAMQFRGMMYKWGGSNPKTSFDCSGLVQYVYSRLGVKLPRVSADQARSGTAVSMSQARPGDLIWWDNSSRNRGADHIGIYMGNGQYIDAPRTGSSIGVRSLGNRGANFTRVT